MLWILIVLSANLLLAGPIAPNYPINVKLDFDKAIGMLNANDLNGAQTQLLKILSIDARFVPALVAMAEIRLKQGANLEAESFFQRALKVDSKSAPINRSYARYLFSQGKLDSAATALITASRSANSATIQVELGELRLTQSKASLALQAFQQAASLEPANPFAYRGMGTAFALLEKKVEAEAKFLKAVSLAPNDAAFLFPLAVFYKEQNNFAKSEELFRKSLLLKPKDSTILAAFGDLYAGHGGGPKAIELYNQANLLSPTASIFVRIGMLQQQSAHLSEAEAAYRKALQLKPDTAVAMNNLAFLLLSQKRQLPEAESWAKKAIATAPAMSSYHDTLAMIYQAQGNNTAALALLEKAAKLTPANPDIFYHLGLLHAGRKNTSLASTYLGRAIALDPKSSLADEARRHLKALGR